MTLYFRLIGFLLLFSPALYSQEDKLTVTVHAGSMFSTIKPEPKGAADPKWRTGFQAGASLNWQLNERFYVPVTAQFSQRGFYANTESAYIVIDGQIALFRGRVDYRLSYLDLMPQLAFKPVRYLSISAGPYLSWRLGESVRYGDVIDWKSTKDIPLYRDTDLGLAVRLGVHAGPVSVFAGYLFGLSNVASEIILVDENGQTLGELSAKTRAFHVGAGFQF